MTIAAPSTWSFYDAAGTISPLQFMGFEEHLAANTPAGTTAIAGAFDGTWQRVQAGVVVSFSPIAPADTVYLTWAWSDALKRWISTRTVAGIRADKAAMLARQIATLEDGQVRLLRELLIVLTTGLVPTVTQIAQIKAAEAAVVALRVQM